MQTLPIALAKGDGIGPEIMDAVISIFRAAGAPLEFVEVEMGKSVFERGFSSGMTPAAKQLIELTGILFKGPMETPKGKGMKSINVTARKVWNTYANKRVFKSLHGVDTVFSKAGIPINITIVRENIEDTYGGIEHMLTQDVALCRRFITRPGSMQVHRYAFDMAVKKGAKKITCGHKANIMKLTDGLFLECFYEVAKDYPQIEANDVIVDDLAMKLVVKPQEFDVVVLPNLQGDIISDLCAGLVGGLGFAPSANIGDHISIFEAVHGTAPDIAGKDLANPTSLLLSGCMLLRHVGLIQHALRIEEALYLTLQKGIHTRDIARPGAPSYGTKAFAEQIIQHLPASNGNGSVTPQQITYRPPQAPQGNRMMLSGRQESEETVGVDLFVESTDQPSVLAEKIKAVLPEGYALTLISNRGTQVFPYASLFTDCINQYRVRIEADQPSASITQHNMLDLSAKVANVVRLCSIEWLMLYGGKKAYSLAQGQ
ncbi:MAG TPA: isocitrate dehydrogenase [Chitinophagaceae bacterium]|nr:isocitrate dehydrogenase [Chitinophagaceae bacterium]